MTTPNLPHQNQPVAPPVAPSPWEKPLADAAFRAINAVAGDGQIKRHEHEKLDQITAILRKLNDDINRAKEYERYDPRNLASFILKNNYRERERIAVGSEVQCLQALPDGAIVSGSYDATIRIWRKGADDTWTSTVLKGHEHGVRCLQALPDGTVMSGGGPHDCTIRIWKKGADVTWTSAVLKGHTNWVRCLQALPDGTIVSGDGDGTIRIWKKGANDTWTSAVLQEHTGSVSCLQALPDGTIVSGGLRWDLTIRIWDGSTPGDENTPNPSVWRSNP